MYERYTRIYIGCPTLMETVTHKSSKLDLVQKNFSDKIYKILREKI